MNADVGTGVQDLGSKAKGQGEQLAHAKTLGWLARAGLVARGVVYGIIGILALKLALGDGGKATDQEGALQTIAHQSFGKALLVLVAIGLGGYALWRLIRAAVGHGAEQRDSTFERISALDSGIAYGLLCIAAVEILTSSSGGSGSTKQTTAGVLGWTGGTVLVGVWLIVEPHNGTLTLTFVLGVYFLFMGLTRTVIAFIARGEPNAGLLGLSGIAGLLIGILILAKFPSSADWAIGLLVGIDLIFAGWTLVSVALLGKDLARRA
jgi:uncharacterized membrane protein HdeD (DUF308 family)